MSSVLFGSISTLADTSELQRESFNEAFKAHDLDWHWDREAYQDQLQGNGGQQRIADFAAELGDDVDAAAVHQSKSDIFQARLASASLSARPGVVATITAAKDAGHKVGLVTTTSAENVRALLAALGDDLDSGAFDVIVDSSHVTESKPDPAAYVFALDKLGEQGTSAVAIEDNVGGIAAAKAAGVTAIAFPNENTAAHDFAAADLRVDELDVDAVTNALSRG